MTIDDVPSFLDYYRRIRQRTLRVAECIPPEHIEWTYRPGKWTFGDLLRHVAGLERYMFAENVHGRPSCYPGCGRELADGLPEVLAYVNRLHAETLDLLGQLSNADLQARCHTPAGTPITVWKWLRGMVEHEVHHRGQIYLYLAMLEIPTPPLYGLTAEQVQQRSAPPG